MMWGVRHEVRSGTPTELLRRVATAVLENIHLVKIYHYLKEALALGTIRYKCLDLELVEVLQ